VHTLATLRKLNKYLKPILSYLSTGNLLPKRATEGKCLIFGLSYKIQWPAQRTQCKASTYHSHINFGVLHIVPMWNLKPLIELVFISDTYQSKQQNKRYKNETCEKIWHNGCRTSFWLPKQVLQSSQSSLVRLLTIALHSSNSVQLWIFDKNQPTIWHTV